MMSRTDRAYKTATCQCIDAMYSLQRYEGTAAIEKLKAAIRTIENEQRDARRDRNRGRAAAPRFIAEPPPAPVDF